MYVTCLRIWNCMQIGEMSQYNKAYIRGYLGIQWPINKINMERRIKDFKYEVVVSFAQYYHKEQNENTQNWVL
jgi:hypothetical protein